MVGSHQLSDGGRGDGRIGGGGDPKRTPAASLARALLVLGWPCKGRRSAKVGVSMGVLSEGVVTAGHDIS